MPESKIAFRLFFFIIFGIIIAMERFINNPQEFLNKDKEQSSFEVQNQEQAINDKLLKLMEKTERPKADAGIEFEYMVYELLKDIPGWRVILSSEYDDKDLATEGRHFDLLVILPDGGKLALEVTGTENKERLKKKLEALVSYPMLTEIHDDDGNIILKEYIPRAFAGYDKKIWGQVLNESKNKKLNHSSDAFVDKNQEKVKLLKNMIVSIEFEKKYRRDYEEFFEQRIKILKNSLDMLEREKEEVYH